ncbi:hypothetical protein BDR26DRAFT_1009796 [Obelidium mucronatum]|nr:hypothetical protein BDR26DRAFT_1009796 [Obelidium mucronatum]
MFSGKKAAAKEKAAKEAAYKQRSNAILRQVQTDMSVPYQETLADIVSAETKTKKVPVLIVGGYKPGENSMDEQFADSTTKLLEEMGVIVYNSTSLSQNVKDAMAKKLDPAQLTGADLATYDAVKGCPTMFIESNEALRNQEFIGIHAQHTDRFTAVHVGTANSWGGVDIQGANAQAVADLDQNFDRLFIQVPLDADAQAIKDNAEQACGEMRQMLAEDLNPQAVAQHQEYDYFVSYDWEHAAEAREFALAAQKEGKRVFLDFRNMHESIPETMAQSVQNSKVVFAFHSEKYGRSKNCGAEHFAAITLGKPIFVSNSDSTKLGFDNRPEAPYTKSTNYLLEQGEMALNQINNGESVVSETSFLLTRDQLIERNNELRKQIEVTNKELARNNGKAQTVEGIEKLRMKPFKVDGKTVIVYGDANQKDNANQIRQGMVNQGVAEKDISIVSAADMVANGVPSADNAVVLCDGLLAGRNKVETQKVKQFISNQGAASNKVIVVANSAKEVLHNVTALAGVGNVTVNQAAKYSIRDMDSRPQQNFSQVSQEYTKLYQANLVAKQRLESRTHGVAGFINKFRQAAIDYSAENNNPLKQNATPVQDIKIGLIELSERGQIPFSVKEIEEMSNDEIVDTVYELENLEIAGMGTNDLADGLQDSTNDITGRSGNYYMTDTERAQKQALLAGQVDGLTASNVVPGNDAVIPTNHPSLDTKGPAVAVAVDHDVN